MAEEISTMNSDQVADRSRRGRRSMIWLTVAAVLFTLLVIVGPVARKLYVFERLRTLKQDRHVSTKRDAPRWLRERLGKRWVQSFETADSIVIDSETWPIILRHSDLFQQVTTVSVHSSMLSGVSGHPGLFSEAELLALYGGTFNDSDLQRLFRSELPVQGASDERQAPPQQVVFPNLDKLSLTKTGITDEQLKYLSGLHGLTSLTLDETPITDTGLRHLEKLTELKHLSLVGTDIEGSGLKHLAGMKRLNDLRLRGTPFDDEGMALLPKLAGLETLFLSDTQVTDAGLVNLTKFKRLESVFLDGTAVTDAGMQHLARVSQLRSLTLRRTQVGDQGLARLVLLPRLYWMGIGDSYITKEGAVTFNEQRRQAGMITCIIDK